MKALRWGLTAIGALVALVAVAIVVLGWRSPREQYFSVDPQSVPVPAADDVEAIERGQYLTHAVAVCGVCHGPDLAGQKMSDSVVYGYIVTPNLTPGRGGIGASYEVVDWVRAIRHGVTREGRAFAFMPVDHYFHITDSDLGDMIAYLRHLPAVDNEGGAFRLGLLPKAIINSGLLGDLVRAKIIDHRAPRPLPAPSRGTYLAQIGGCDFCHGPALRGGQGPEPGAPPGPDITGAGLLRERSFEQFVAAMRTGAMPGGRQINSMHMPWLGYRNMNDADLRILYDHLRALGDPPGGAHGSNTP